MRRADATVRLAGLLSAVALALGPSAASAQQPNPFTPLPPAQTATPTVTSTTPTTSTTGSTSSVSTTTI